MEKWLTLDQVMSRPEASDEELRQAMAHCIRQVLHNMPTFETQFPEANSHNNFYDPGDNPRPSSGWTCGFWTGEVWLSYENTDDPSQRALLRTAAEKQVQTFLDRIDRKLQVDHHDMGFLYSPSCVAAYKLTGSRIGKEAALKAADQLLCRYQPVGEYLQAWGDMNAPDNHRLIIDCLLNVPLLYWATEVSGDDRYRQIAEKHIHTTMRHIVREDNSTWHTIFFDAETGAFQRGATCQGYRDTTAWARGQAWGIYGTAIAYKNTGRAAYIDYFRRVSDYFLRHLPDDLCPFWDLSFGMGDEAAEPRDSSAAAIAACGFLEMSRHLPAQEAAFYTRAAKKLLYTLIHNYQVTDPAVSNGQLLHGVYARKSPYNTCVNAGVDECVVWGDYFFMEALTRTQNPDWTIYW